MNALVLATALVWAPPPDLGPAGEGGEAAPGPAPTSQPAAPPGSDETQPVVRPAKTTAVSGPGSEPAAPDSALTTPTNDTPEVEAAPLPTASDEEVVTAPATDPEMAPMVRGAGSAVRPPSGSGLLGSGVVLTAVGINALILAGVTTPLLIEGYSFPLYVAGGAVLSLGVGVPMLIVGAIRRGRYSRWSREHPGARPDGRGLLWGGVALFAVSTPWLVLGLVDSEHIFTLGGAVPMAAGVGMAIAGGVLYSRRNQPANRIAVAPWATPTGAGFGVAGRF